MSKAISTKISDENYEEIRARAKAEGTRPSDVIRAGINFILRIDPDVMRTAQRFSAGHCAEAADLFNNAVIRTFAENQAHIDVYGEPLPNLFTGLFSWEIDLEDSKRKLVTGNQLYATLKQGFTKTFENELERELEAQGKAVGGIEKLSEEDQFFLKKMAQRRAQRKASHRTKIEEESGESFKDV